MIFEPTDFDISSQTSIQDLIDNARKSPPETSPPTRAQQAIYAQKPIQRLVCMVCGESITDDKFTTIRDAANITLYLHSKGKCDARHENTEKVRREFLSRYTPSHQDSTNSAYGSGKEKEAGTEGDTKDKE